MERNRKIFISFTLECLIEEGLEKTGAGGIQNLINGELDICWIFYSRGGMEEVLFDTLK